MYFNVEQDLGHSITGYLVPDSFSARGRILVSSRGRLLASLETDRQILSLVTVGRHETGFCGFSLDDASVPGLETLDYLEITDAETGLLIFRRTPPDQYLPLRLVRLETHMVPLRRLDRAVAPRFCYAYREADWYGLESATQMFYLMHPQSLYISGRFAYKPFEDPIMRDFRLVCMVNDPYEELAERLLLLRHAARRPGRLAMRDALAFNAATVFAAGLDLHSDRALRRSFGRIGADAAGPLTNPLVRQLTTRTADDMPRSSYLATALSILASCFIVGRRDDSESFAAALAEMLGMTIDSVPVVGRCNAAMALAERLRPIPAVQDLLGFDVTLYHHVVEAFKKAG